MSSVVRLVLPRTPYSRKDQKRVKFYVMVMVMVMVIVGVTVMAIVMAMDMVMVRF